MTQCDNTPLTQTQESGGADAGEVDGMSAHDGSAEPQTKPEPDGVVEPQGMICVGGPINGKLHRSDGPDMFEVKDLKRAWVGHTYRRVRMDVQCGACSHPASLMWWAYWGVAESDKGVIA